MAGEALLFLFAVFLTALLLFAMIFFVSERAMKVAVYRSTFSYGLYRSHLTRSPDQRCVVVLWIYFDGTLFVPGNH